MADKTVVPECIADVRLSSALEMVPNIVSSARTISNLEHARKWSWKAEALAHASCSNFPEWMSWILTRTISILKRDSRYHDDQRRYDLLEIRRALDEACSDAADRMQENESAWAHVA